MANNINNNQDGRITSRDGCIYDHTANDGCMAQTVGRADSSRHHVARGQHISYRQAVRRLDRNSSSLTNTTHAAQLHGTICRVPAMDGSCERHNEARSATVGRGSKATTEVAARQFTFTIGSTEGRAGRPVNSLNGTGDSSIDCRRNRNTYSRYQARPGGESILSASFGAGSLTNVPLGSMLDEARKPYALNPTKSTDCYSAPVGIAWRSPEREPKGFRIRLVGN